MPDDVVGVAQEVALRVGLHVGRRHRPRGSTRTPPSASGPMCTRWSCPSTTPAGSCRRGSRGCCSPPSNANSSTTSPTTPSPPAISSLRPHAGLTTVRVSTSSPTCGYACQVRHAVPSCPARARTAVIASGDAGELADDGVLVGGAVADDPRDAFAQRRRRAGAASAPRTARAARPRRAPRGTAARPPGPAGTPRSPTTRPRAPGATRRAPVTRARGRAARRGACPARVTAAGRRRG